MHHAGKPRDVAGREEWVMMQARAEAATSDAARDDVVLRVEGITKSFARIPVLQGVSLELPRGTVTALSGENGAGKSTLMKIISGLYRPDSGTVSVNGNALSGGDVREAQRLGVAIVPQELAAIDDMTVYENLFVGREIRTSLGLLDRRAMIARSRELLRDFGVDISPSATLRSLPVGLQQIVEIVKNSSRGADVLLLDEPTSAISEREVESLYAVVRRLRQQGTTMVFTTHKMEEIRALADHVVVLRDGVLALDAPMGRTSDDDIVTAMIGRELEDLFPEHVAAPEDAEMVLDVADLQVVGASGPVSLQVRRGEIVGLAGLVGAGRTELIEAVFGVRAATAGTVGVAGASLRLGDPRTAIAAGVALVPEDRKGSGVVLTMDVLDNGTLPHLSSFDVGGWLRQRARRTAVGKAMASVRLRSNGLGQEVGTLSGGNQQKVVLARWLTQDVDVLLLDEPTRGVDVGARSEIYRIVVDLAASGMAVLMASSDMPEVLGLSHRVLVMRGGVVAHELDRADLSHDDVQETIFRAASGMADDPQTATREDHER